MKKLLSIFIATVMLLSMVNISCAAEENITVEYINANSSEIVIELSQSVDASDLKDAITLKKVGEIISPENYTVSAKSATPTPDYTEHMYLERSSKYISMRPLSANANYTYVIKPSEGLAFDTEYSLKISDTLLGVGYLAKITVNKIAHDTFDYTTDTTPWKKGASADPNPIYSNGELTLESSKAVYLNHASNIFADTGKAANTYRSSSSVMKKINVEAKVKFADTTKRHIAGLGIANTSTTLTIGKDCLTSAVSFAVGGDSASNNSNKHTALFIAKYEKDDVGDPVYTNYPGTIYTNFYATATKANGSSGNYISNVNNYGMYLPDTTSEFASDQYTKLTMYYNAAEYDGSGKLVKAGKVIYEGGNDLYNYSFDMPVTVKPLPFIFNSGASTATFDDLIISTANIEEIELESYDFSGPTYWNAASDTITLDFDAPILASELQDKIALYDATGTKIEGLTVKPLTDVTREGNFTGKYTYQIKLPAMFTDDAIYTLVLPKGTYTDANDAPAKLVNDYTITFSVDLFVLEDFESYSEDASAYYSTKMETNFPWAVLSGGKYGKIDVEDAGGNKYLKVENTGSSNAETGKTWIVPSGSVSSPKFANTGLSGMKYSEASEETAGRFKSDYTMEADIKVVQEGSEGYQVKMMQASHRDIVTAKPHNALTVAKASDGTLSIGVYAHNGIGDSTLAYIKNHKATQGVDLASDDYVRLSMSIKDRDHKWTVGNLLLHEVVAAGTPTAQKIGIPVFDIDDKKVNNIYYIDNVILSKATELDPMVCGDIVINGNPDITELPNTNNIETAKVSVTNRGQAKSFVALLAVFNSADGSLVNVYKKAPTGIAAAATEDVTFTDVDISGGDRIEIYIWDDLNGITAYTEAKVMTR